MRLPANLPETYAPVVEREVEVNGCRVSYTEAGEGPPVLLLHGAVFGGNVFWWENQAALAGRFRTLAPDLPGWGASEKPRAAYTVDFYHEFITGFLDRLGLERVPLVGHSMGGLLASSYALRHPERVSHLVTVAAPPAWIEFGVPLLFKPFTVPLLGEAVMGALPWLGPRFPLGVRGFYEGLFHAPRQLDPARMQRALQGCVDATADRAHRAAFLSTMRDNLHLFRPGVVSPFRELRDRATFPIMMMAGREDRLFPLTLLERGAAAMPGTLLEVVGACGHFPQWEQAATVERLVGEFCGA